MVCVNTNTNIEFTHFVDIPTSDCVIGAALDDRRRIKLYLIVNGNGPIYVRNGLCNTWDQLSSVQQAAVRKLASDALADSRIPHYSTDTLSTVN